MNFMSIGLTNNIFININDINNYIRLINYIYYLMNLIEYVLPNKKILIGSYHPSPRNVNTKRINLNKMVKLLNDAKKLI